MKPYIQATLLCIILTPIVGATMMGVFSGNPFIIFWPAVLPVAFVLTGFQSLLLGATGSVWMYYRQRQDNSTTVLQVIIFGIVFGILSTLAPLLIFQEPGEIKRSSGILMFLCSGIIAGVVSALLGFKVIQSQIKKSEHAPPAGRGEAPRP